MHMLPVTHSWTHLKLLGLINVWCVTACLVLCILVCGLLTLAPLPACRSKTLAPATLGWSSKRCFYCWFVGMQCALAVCQRRGHHNVKFTQLRCAAD